MRFENCPFCSKKMKKKGRVKLTRGHNSPVFVCKDCDFQNV